MFSGAEKSTGGQIVPEKTKWYLLGFIWDSAGRWCIYNNDAHILLPTQYGTQAIKRLLPYHSSRILGVWIAPKGAPIDKKKRLRALTTVWLDRVKSVHIIKSEAWYCFQTTVKIAWIPLGCHNYDKKTVPIDGIPCSMCSASSIRATLHYSEERDHRTANLSWTQQWLLIWNSRRKKHLRSDESWYQQQNHIPPS